MKNSLQLAEHFALPKITICLVPRFALGKQTNKTAVFFNNEIAATSLVNLIWAIPNKHWANERISFSRGYGPLTCSANVGWKRKISM
jgi:hypothetical protein